MKLKAIFYTPHPGNILAWVGDQKITVSRDFLEGGNPKSPTGTLEDQVKLKNSNRLDQRTDAFSTQHFPNLATILENRDCLQIGAEGAWRGFLRPGSVSTKGRRLPAMFTLRHLCPSFLPQ
jgi:hypothetical protein